MLPEARSADAAQAARANPPLEIHEIRDLASFLALEREWNDLLERSGVRVPYLRHEWLAAWYDRFGKGASLSIFLVRDQGRLLLALPLLEERRRACGILSVRLHSFTNGHSYASDLIAEPGRDDAIAALFRQLRHRRTGWDVMEVLDLSEDGAALGRLLAGARGEGLAPEVTLLRRSPFLVIEGSWEQYVATLRSKHRANLRRRKKKLEELGEVRLRIARTPEEFDAAFALLCALEQKSWKGEEGSAVACSPGLLEFYRRVGTWAARNGWLRLFLLEAGGRPVSADFSMLYGSRLWCMKIAYDPDYASCSVGQLLCEAVLARCFGDERVEGYEFLGIESEQKGDWTSTAHPILSLRCHSDRMMARVLRLWTARVKPRLRRLLRKTRLLPRS
ncbi:MAG: GNAT family N-acetyltransferase [Planctomycetaceae bacterium]